MDKFLKISTTSIIISNGRNGDGKEMEKKEKI
jgi:hypothetical protein